MTLLAVIAITIKMIRTLDDATINALHTILLFTFHYLFHADTLHIFTDTLLAFGDVSANIGTPRKSRILGRTGRIRTLGRHR
jgi:hypothetical protein